MKKYFMFINILLCGLIAVVDVYATDLDIFKGLSGSLSIAGGTAHISCEKEAIKLIIQYNPNIHITIAGGGSGIGIKQVCANIIDIGNSGRKPTQSEITRCNLKIFKFAIDGIGVIVNPKMEVTNISSKELIDIFSGKITNWKELGGIDAPIHVYTRNAESGTRKVFWKKGLNRNRITNRANFVVSNSAMKTAIASDPLGIGYISLGVADSSVKLLAIDGVFPSLENIKSGRYKISRGLYMVTKGEPSGLAKAFISYMLSDEGQTLVKKHGFMSVR